MNPSDSSFRPSDRCAITMNMTKIERLETAIRHLTEAEKLIRQCGDNSMLIPYVCDHIDSEALQMGSGMVALIMQEIEDLKKQDSY